tara:strand:- start:325 stop:678 length:354 start_codon:yes stop_codon:yes gene_type:complete
MKGFTTNKNKGFQMKFNNGFIISVQWGTMNYCEVYTKHFKIDGKEEMKTNHWESETAEIAVFNEKQEMIPLTERDCVIGWLTPNEVAECIEIVSSATSEEEIIEKIRNILIVDRSLR